MTLAIYPLSGKCDHGVAMLRQRRAAPIKDKNRQVMTTDQKDDGSLPNDLSTKLVAIAASADMAAFEALFREFSPRIRAYLLKMTRDAQASEDLMQETMLAIWRKAGQFDPARGHASAWIYTIARNIWIDAWRRQRRPAFDLDDPALVADPEPDAPKLMEDKQSRAAVHAALETLPKEQVELIKLSFFEEASHSTIAERLGLPIGTVKSRIRLAFGRLRTALEDLK
jgi:RNA polymerase sigma-70 factor (ECF subfamily)